MPHRHLIRAALAVGLAATALAAPAQAAPAAAEATPSAAETAPAGVPAVTLLHGAAPTTITPDDEPAPAATALTVPRCGRNPIADGTAPAPCPPGSTWTNAATFAVVKQPHPSVDQHATPAGGPSAPSLLLLDQLLPRAALPTGRTTHLDPRPA